MIWSSEEINYAGGFLGSDGLVSLYLLIIFFNEIFGNSLVEDNSAPVFGFVMLPRLNHS